MSSGHLIRCVLNWFHLEIHTRLFIGKQDLDRDEEDDAR